MFLCFIGFEASLTVENFLSFFAFVLHDSRGFHEDVLCSIC